MESDKGARYRYHLDLVCRMIRRCMRWRLAPCWCSCGAMGTESSTATYPRSSSDGAR